MNNKIELIKDAYKIPRNHLRSVPLVRSLQIIWGYSNYLTMGRDFPRDVKPHPAIFEKDYGKRNSFIAPWNLETLTREVIINAGHNSPSKSFDNPNYFGEAVNKIKRFDEYVSSLFVTQENIQQEVFFRLSNFQFPWQVRPNKENIMKYYKVFNNPSVSKIIEKKIGTPYDRLLFAGFSVWAMFCQNSHIKTPVNILIPLKQKELEDFLTISVSNLSEIKKELTESCHKDSTYLYSFNPMKIRPIIAIEENGQNYLYCPLPQLLYWKFTGGIYYEIVNEKGFDKAFGTAFQDLVGEVILKTVNRKRFTVLEESLYKVKGEEKGSVDWRLKESKESIVFFECKTKRMTLKAKVELSDGAIVEQFNHLSKMVIQTYKTINDYKNGYYQDDKPEKNQKIYPVVVTLEDWYNISNSRKLDEVIRSEVTKHNLSEDIVDELPYIICTVDELRMILNLVNIKGINTVFKTILKPEYKGWAVHSILNNAFKEEVGNMKHLFENEFEEIMNDHLKKNGKDSKPPA